MSLTKTLGQFVADLSPNRLPEEAVRVARLGFIDCIGTMIAGRREDCVRIMKQVLAPADGPATLTFGNEKSTAPEAAWINGTAAHALDYDDVGLRGHPSTVLVPAILAEAEALGSTGADMIVAYVAGYETWAELFRRDSGLLHQKGWHPTGLYGAVGAAAACAIAAPSGCRQGGAGDRPRRLAKLRPDGEFRHDDQAVPRRQGGACRHHGGAPGRGRLHRQHRRAGTSAGLPARDLPHRHRGSHQRGEARARPGRSSRRVWASRNIPPATALIARSTACSIW